MLTKRLGLIASLVLLLSSTVSAQTQHLRVELADRVVEGLIDDLKSEGPHPLLILVTGDDIDIQDRLYASLAAKANAEKFVTLRLDWSYKKKKGSPDPKREAEELGIIMNQVISSRMMKQYEVDLTKVALMAKGYGARIAMDPDTGGTSTKVKATLLLNPTCDAASGSFTKTYASFLAEKTPRMIIDSQENGACTLPQIYAAAKDFGENLALYTAKANSDTVIAVGLGWLKNRGWVPDAPAGKKLDAKRLNVKRHMHEAQSAGTHP